MTEPIAFIDLQAQRRRLGARIDDAIARVLESGQFILGAEVAAFEEQLAAFCGARHAIGCANGTDAMQLALIVKGIGSGDAVFVPAFTFAATAEAVALVGATPVFVDVLPQSFNMDPASLEEAVAEAKKGALRPAGTIPVDLFGQPADYPSIQAVADEYGLSVIADAAQAFGAALNGTEVGRLAEITATSFFPAKPLGCYGDGGAVLTDDDERAATLRSLRAHGRGGDQYDSLRLGLNSRLDALQAAILIEKLVIFADEIVARQRIAERYRALLHDVVAVPETAAEASSVWAQYTVLLDDRDALRINLAEAGVATAVYYPRPLHRQTAYRDYPRSPSGLSISERLSEQVLSLPMHPYLDELTQDKIVDAVRGAVGKG